MDLGWKKHSMQLLSEQVAKFRSLGQVIICGDFNALCGELDMDIEGVPPQETTDSVKNSQGEVFADFVRGMNMVAVNGRKGRDAFTYISGRGSSVSDYCVVEEESFDLIDNFRVSAMSECIDEMCCKGEATRVPDHSLIQWEVLVGWVNEKEPEEAKHGNGTRKVAPEDYLESEVGRVKELTERVMQAGADQGVIDGVYI